LPPSTRDVIVVTGAAGFLGSRVVPLLRRELGGARVIAVVRRARDGRVPPGVQIVEGDLRSAAVWRALPAGVTHVVHLAVRIPWDRRHANRPQVVLDNLAPVAHLLHESAAWPRLRRVVYGSSVSVYAPSPRRLRESSPTRPVSLYGAVKLAGERLLDLLAGRDVTVASLRFSSLYGAGQYSGTVLPLMAGRARQGRPIELFNPRRVQDFLHVDDAARATTLACRNDARGAFNVGTGRSVSMATLARTILRAFDERDASRIVEGTHRPGNDPGLRLDVGRARRELGYEPRIGLRDGLSRLARELAGAEA
jgi:UDP-glucose 4-epimerase